MKFTAVDFTRLYADMPDDELRSLVREELSEVARPCYDAELARRGLLAAKPRRAVQPVAVPDEAEAVAPESEDVPEEAVEQEEEEDLAPAAVFTRKPKPPRLCCNPLRSRHSSKTIPWPPAGSGCWWPRPMWIAPAKFSSCLPRSYRKASCATSQGSGPRLCGSHAPAASYSAVAVNDTLATLTCPVPRLLTKICRGFPN
jgi:hypothetical protein